MGRMYAGVTWQKLAQAYPNQQAKQWAPSSSDYSGSTPSLLQALHTESTHSKTY